MELLQWIVIFILALITLVKSADFFTSGAEKIGIYMGLSSFIVGATIVALGSSLPEIATSIFAVQDGVSSFPIDNIIGSNIANCLLVGGIASIAVGNLKVKNRLISIDLPFFFLSTSLFILFILDGYFTVYEGVIGLILLGVFVWYTISDKGTDNDVEREIIECFQWKWVVLILGGCVGIFFGAEYTITSVGRIANILEISPSIVTILAVAIGTSLPELIISVKAALQGKHSIAMGNIFGSNTINALAVTGIPSFFGTLTVSNDAQSIGIAFLMVASLGFIFATLDDKIPKWEGFAFLVLYAAFVGKIIGIV